MRIIAGKGRSLPLKTIEGIDTRPTTDRIKETLFNMLQYEIADCPVLRFVCRKRTDWIGSCQPWSERSCFCGKWEKSSSMYTG